MWYVLNSTEWPVDILYYVENTDQGWVRFWFLMEEGKVVEAEVSPQPLKVFERMFPNAKRTVLGV